MKRAKTGIEKLDEICEGGFPENSNIVVAGTPGTGKTILGLQFIYDGAEKFKEKGVYVSLEQRADALRKQCKRFGWDVSKLEKQKKVSILEFTADTINREIFEKIKKEVKRIKAKRLVIDSLSLIVMSSTFIQNEKYSLVEDGKIKSSTSAKQFIYTFIQLIEKLGCTTLFITGLEKDTYNTEDGISEYLTDGSIVLRSRTMGQTLMRTIEIIKMRMTEIKGGIYTMDITNKGIEVRK